jgi:hypothetical protein
MGPSEYESAGESETESNADVNAQWVDRETGIAGLLATQVLPPGDPMVTKCLLELETALYSHIRSS